MHDAPQMAEAETQQPETDQEEKVMSLKDDLMVLTKVRLNVFVLITTVFGYILASRHLEQSWVADFWILLHTVIGTAAAAFGSAVFNQLMEIEQDKRMKRTQNRPLPSNRIKPMNAFLLGWGLAALGVIHLGVKVNASSAYLAAATIVTYVFVYTPMKRKSSSNTLIGAIPGAIPPMIGWAAVAGDAGWYDWRSWYLFAVLFFWQLPHFVAINWFCRVEYEEAGYEMWSNGDETGVKTAKLALIFSLCLTSLSPLAAVLGYTGWITALAGTLLGLQMCRMSVKFSKAGTREAARKLFLYTLLYLPLILGLLAIGWN